MAKISNYRAHKKNQIRIFIITKEAKT